MNENKLAAGLILISTSLLIYLLAKYILKNKKYHLFSGWDETKMINADAYGQMLCKSLTIFAGIFTMSGLMLVFINQITNTFFIAIILITVTISTSVLVYYMLKAKRLYGK